jgi:C4-dicarboxylate transporter, DctM subunit
MIAILLFFSFILLVLIGVPVAISVGLSSIIVLAVGEIPLVLFPQRLFAGIDSFPLIAVPFFILAGDLMAEGKMSKLIVNFAETLFGFMRGGLWIISVIASAFFAAISGSGGATTAAIGTPLIPELKKRNYDPKFSAALIACSGGIGVVIPPSVPMVLYALIANESISRLFLNGFIPGIMMAAVLIFMALRKANKENYPKGNKISFNQIVESFKSSIWGLMTPVIILGGIFSGYFTPSEAAVIAVDWALIVSLFIYRDKNLKDIFRIFVKSVITSSLIMLLIGTAQVFSWVLANWNIPVILTNAVLSISDNRFIILLFVNIILLIAGVFMETASIIIILTPIFLGLMTKIGVDPVHFGIIMTIALAIGMSTPPVAINLYIASSISGYSIEKISREALPLILAMIAVLFVVTYLPLFIPLIF